MSDDRVPIEVASIWPAEADEEGIGEGVVVNWFVKEGRHVNEGGTLCEIQIEKVSIDVKAPTGGEIDEIAIGEDETVGRDDILGWISPA